MIGTKLAHYSITAHLGSGGMGEVYQATDSKLGRSVAIKLLPEAFTDDPDRSARFEREARVLASLNHPNIATIHGVEESGGRKFLVMELVTGETLAEKIKRGAIPLDESLGIATQITEALEAAHEKGVIHRDLKPANIKVTPEGKVKVLDFGLAKAFAGETANASLSNSPTMSHMATQMGMILGTAAYMSPEQAKGKEVDRRTDIFAFGAVLYEMLTGRQAFGGEDVAEILGAVLKLDPDWALLPASVRPRIREMLKLCLQKDAKKRRQAAGDIRIDMELASSEHDPIVPTSIHRRERLVWGAAAIVLFAVAIALGTSALLRKDPVPSIVRFEISPPQTASFTGTPPRFAVSPDGKYLVFAAMLPGKPEQLWMRRLDSPEATPIAGTESVPGDLQPQFPFWSPDSKHIGFIVQTELGAAGTSKVKKVDIDGGPVQTLCELPSNDAGATWNANGVILVSTQATKGIQRIPENGGVPVQVTMIDKSEQMHLFPYFLPDGRHFLYQSQTPERANWAIFIGSLDSSERKMLVRSDYAQLALPDLVLYEKSDALYAQRMDLKKLELIGEPALVSKSVGVNRGTTSNGRAGFSVSNAGVLVYSAGSGGESSQTANRQMVWVDRSGKLTAPLGAPIERGIRLSPDSKHVAFSETTNSTSSGDIWIFDIERAVKTRLTSDAGNDLSPIWSSDNSRLFFSSTRDNNGTSLYEVPSNGAVPEQLLLGSEGGFNLSPVDASIDGKWVLFTKGKPGNRDLWALPLLGDKKPIPYIATKFDEREAVISPNSRWVAYSSNESGTYQIIVQPFPDPSGGKTPISTNGGTAPRWRRDGRELYFYDSYGHIVAVSVTTDGNFQVGKSVNLFDAPFGAPGGFLESNFLYDAAADGQRFLASVTRDRLSSAPAPPLTVTLNWMSTLK